MIDERGRVVWSFLTAMTVALSLWSLAPALSSDSDFGCCLDNGTCEVTLGANCSMSNFSPGLACGMNGTCVEPLVGCCETDIDLCASEGGAECLGLACVDGVSEFECLGAGSHFVPGAVCDVGMATTSQLGGGVCVTPTATPDETATATSTPTVTSTPTATNTLVPDGGSCVDPVDCVSGNCVEDLCCDTACDGPGEACDLAGMEGTCLTTEHMAPTASNRGLAVLAAVLAAGGFFMAARRRELRDTLRSFFSL